jgi:hypothetical protein
MLLFLILDLVFSRVDETMKKKMDQNYFPTSMFHSKKIKSSAI